MAKENEEVRPEWVKMSPKDIEKLIMELGKQGETPEKIGLILRDKHGIPKAGVLGLKISTVLKEAGIKFPGLKENEQNRIASLEKHLAEHKHDASAKRSLAKKLWIVHKLSAAN